MWQLRENIPVSLMQLSRSIFNNNNNNNNNNNKMFGKLYKFDISLPLKETDKFIADLKILLNEEVMIIIYFY
jgi:hypothetical protein